MKIADSLFQLATASYSRKKLYENTGGELNSSLGRFFLFSYRVHPCRNECYVVQGKSHFHDKESKGFGTRKNEVFPFGVLAKDFVQQVAKSCH